MAAPKEGRSKARKKDKRSVSTEKAIKESLLDKLEGGSFRELTVSEICIKAEITRATFYQHYGNLGDVLDDLLDDVASELGDVPLEICEGCGSSGLSPKKEIGWTGLPFCHLLASGNEYSALLRDNAVAERLIERIVEGGLDTTMARLRERYPDTTASREQLRYFNMFRLSGCLAAARSALRNGQDWSLVQPTLDAAIAAAFGTFE